MHYRHGQTHTRFYRIWNGMIVRCNNPKAKDYKHYGAKGITVCSRWLDFVNFYNDMRHLYDQHIKLNSRANTTLDRINTKDHYYPKNCRWVTWDKQHNNTKRNRPVLAIYIKKGPSFGYREVFTSCARFARKYGLCRRSIHSNIYKAKTSIYKNTWKFLRILHEAKEN